MAKQELRANLVEVTAVNATVTARKGHRATVGGGGGMEREAERRI
jgi:hypothetical protein